MANIEEIVNPEANLNQTVEYILIKEFYIKRNNHIESGKIYPIKWFFRPHFNCLLDKEPFEITSEDEQKSLIVIQEDDNPHSFKEEFIINELKTCIFVRKRRRGEIEFIEVLCNRQKMAEYLELFRKSKVDNRRIYKFILSKFVNALEGFYSKEGSMDWLLKNYIVESVNYRLCQRFPKLYRYQELNVEWMSSIEERVPITFLLPNQKYFPVSKDTEIYFTKDLAEKDYNKKNLYYSMGELVKYGVISEASIRGGLLADEMGTGKTACVVVHLLSKIGRETPPPLIVPEYEGLIPTKANLIIVPNQILAQWVASFEQFAITRLMDDNKTYQKVEPRIIKITGKADFSSVSYNDILEADIVITHYNFLVNPLFIEKYNKEMSNGEENRFLSKTRFYKGTNDADTQKEWLRKCKRHKLTKKAMAEETAFFPRFLWKRVMLDEGHDYLGQYPPLNVMVAEYKWLITGTPMMKIYENLKFLMNGANVNSDVSSGFSPLFNSLAKLDVIRRNTQATASEEAGLGRFRTLETTIKIEFNLNEGLVYQSQAGDERKREFLRQFCCYPFLPQGLQEVKDFLEILKYLNKVEQDEVHKLKQQINILELEIAQLIHERAGNNVLGQKRRSLETLNKSLRLSESKLKYFEQTLIPELQDRNGIKCPVCLCGIAYISITTCGHYLCSTCMDKHLTTPAKHACPHCRGNITQTGSVYKASVISQDKGASNHLDKYGSKVKAIILKIREIMNQDPENAIIIFAEWDRILRTIMDNLNKEKIKTVYCKGNRLCREKAINSFSIDKTCNVICLSSEYASHGTNLTRANKVIFVHPVGQDVQSRKNLEDQAICRAKRIGMTRDLEVIRFVIKDSIEEEIYRNTF